MTKKTIGSNKSPKETKASRRTRSSLYNKTPEKDSSEGGGITRSPSSGNLSSSAANSGSPIIQEDTNHTREQVNPQGSDEVANLSGKEDDDSVDDDKQPWDDAPGETEEEKEEYYRTHIQEGHTFVINEEEGLLHRYDEKRKPRNVVPLRYTSKGVPMLEGYMGDSPSDEEFSSVDGDMADDYNKGRRTFVCDPSVSSTHIFGVPLVSNSTPPEDEEKDDSIPAPVRDPPSLEERGENASSNLLLPREETREQIEQRRKVEEARKEKTAKRLDSFQRLKDRMVANAKRTLSLRAWH
jgi:hypothetical protein